MLKGKGSKATQLNPYLAEPIYIFFFFENSVDQNQLASCLSVLSQVLHLTHKLIKLQAETRLLTLHLVSTCCMRGSRGGDRGFVPPPPLLNNRKAIGDLINTGLDPMENHKATNTAFNAWPPSARQRNAI